MNEIRIFSHPDFGGIRATVIDGEPWWSGKDVAEALGYTNSRKALADHVDEEDKGVTKCDTPGGTQQMTIINESGLYSLILSSKLPSARKFKRWVTSEVLPEIRRTGKFGGSGRDGGISKEDCLRAAEALSSCTGERLPYVAAVLRQAGFSVPEAVTAQRPALPAVAYPPGQGLSLTAADRERMQYETLLRYPHIITDYPDLMRKYPEIAAVAARQKELTDAARQKELTDAGGEPPRKGNREGYGPWFNFRKLRRELEARGMSQKELSRRSGVHPRTLRKYLDGEHRPAAANRGAICDALGVKHGYFDK